MKKLLISSIVAAALVLSFANMNVFAQSSKSGIGSNTLTQINPVSSSDTTSSADPWKTIMSAYLRTPNDKGIALDVALQCGIHTYTQVKSKGKDIDTATAAAGVHVRVRVTDEFGNVGFAQPSEGTDDFGPTGVTYNSRFQEMSAEFQGIIEDCIDPDTGTISITDSCLDYEMVSLLLETLEANAFNFYYGLTDSGVYLIEVQTKLVATSSSGNGAANASAYVGLGSMFVEEVRLVKGTTYDGEVLDLK